MSFGPEMSSGFEGEDDQQAAQPKQNRSANRQNSGSSKSKRSTAALVGLLLGGILAIFGMTYGAFIDPDAEGITPLIMFGVGIVGVAIAAISAKNLARR